MIKNEKCLLLILDGWGTAKENEINKKAREMERSAQNGIKKESASSNT